ncbi:regulatory-associated protein of mTOR isoform X1 [Histomonas meleagridis]|uniref:regulatory-associated protein of mTOR isoform X1 n=1 Tax=Histomonas meleagridis TaxID=135588 RepID=UPI00355A3221|nr:regulatory-associated protein of mTOR isoform X1 [Histomonas meleagridis]KAH0803872.1 regulatory-associated protein of mTOR isoform X1 [Histomonas meleagridis]
MNQELDWKSKIELLTDQETTATWKPFPNNYVNTRPSVDIHIPQISLHAPSIHVLCKITDDFASIQQYAFDEESLPPKVLCWNDVSALDVKMATKTVKSGVEKEYRTLIRDDQCQFSISFQSVSVGNRSHLPLKDSELLVYHVLDPTLSQKSRMTPTVSQSKSKLKTSLKTSLSNNELHNYQETTSINQSKQYFQMTQQPPIHDDIDGLKRLRDEIDRSAIFILDCNFAKKALDVLSNLHQNYIIFAATSGSLLYTPRLPCDLFTSCMLTPAKVALLWQTQNYSDIRSGLLSEIDLQSMIDLFNDSECANDMLSLLEQALVSYVDKMAYESLQDNLQLFYSCFRQNKFLSSLFTNFIFAVRMMKSVSTLPISEPALPDLTYHPLWDSFDLQVDRALYSIKESLNPSPTNLFSMSELLEEQVRKLQTWMLFPAKGRPVPDELPFLELLLFIPEFRANSIKFCSNYVRSSRSAVSQFLNTRAFSILLKSNILEDLQDPETITYFSYLIVNCALFDKSMKKSFEHMVLFWLEHIKSNNEELIIASLSFLLLFSTDPQKLELYHSQNLETRLQELVNHNETKIRTLSHLMLSNMKVPLEFPVKKICDEKAPLCRATFVSRITTTMNSSINVDERLRTELYYDLILSLNDPYQLVREESLVALSHALSNENPQFLASLQNYLSEWRDDKANNPLVTLLGHELQILQFEPSRRVKERLFEFLLFLSNKFDDKNVQPLESNLTNSCLTKIVESTASNLNPPIFSSKAMNVESTLIGIPAFSPSGLFACGDIYGNIHSQVMDSGIIVYDDFVSNKIFKSSLTTRFKPLFNISIETNKTISYLQYIDDMKLLAISNKSQVIVRDVNIIEDSVVSFWMTPPDICNNAIADYNSSSFQILHSTGKSMAHIFDIETQQKIIDIRIPRINIHNMKWLNSYSSLFYIAQNDLSIFDVREKKAVAKIDGCGVDLVNCNCTLAMPLYLMTAHEKYVSIIDMRMMETLPNKICTQLPIQQFEIHKYLPFAVGCYGNKLRSFLFEDENNLEQPEVQDFPGVPDAFSLHPTEASCAVRVGNKIQCMIIDY